MSTKLGSKGKKREVDLGETGRRVNMIEILYTKFSKN